MKIINGKYNHANIMIDEIDETTHQQIQNFCNNPSFKGSYIAIMPDCHAGKGSCVGFTMTLNDRVIPDVVGTDIGCGMLSYQFDITKVDLVALDDFIKKNIPAGFNINAEVNKDKEIVHTYVFNETISRIGLDQNKILRALGTLGGGNHFIEAGYDKSGLLWVTIHSGSRNFGLQIAKYHGAVAKDLCEKWGANDEGMPFLLRASNEGQAYLKDVKIATAYASMNRFYMMEKICSFLGKTPLRQIESIHNFIDETGMIRKGATPAHLSQPLVIPFNMRDGIAICKGKGSRKYNLSAPHGAGRILSRKKAKELLNVENFRNVMNNAGIYSTTVGSDTLDEAPMAYKDMQIILDNISETVEVEDLIKPVYNFKAGGD